MLVKGLASNWWAVATGCLPDQTSWWHTKNDVYGGAINQFKKKFMEKLIIELILIDRLLLIDSWNGLYVSHYIKVYTYNLLFTILSSH